MVGVQRVGAAGCGRLTEPNSTPPSIKGNLMKSVFYFVKGLYGTMPRYREANPWFFRRDYDGYNKTSGCIYYAWKVYRNVKQMVLLGDTNIRKQQDYLRNFGTLAATKKAQDQDLNAVLTEVKKWRKEIASGATGARRRATSTVGTGAILSTQGWSPMLNDALIIGGVDRGVTFCYALTEAEAKIFNDCERAGAASNAAMRKRRKTETHDVADLWKMYFMTNREALWRGGFPRVFVRELLGLKAFGYTAHLSRHQITFSLSRPRPTSFTAYLNCLEDVNFSGNQETQILPHISEFLFGDRDSLR